MATGWQDDVYLNVLEIADDGSELLLRVIVRPLITWIWTGGILMGIGSLLAIIPNRRRGEGEELVKLAGTSARQTEQPAEVGA